MLLYLDGCLFAYYTAAIGMSFALARCYDLTTWGIFSRAMAWPVTIYEAKSGLL
jgi:hypothetical protein